MADVVTWARTLAGHLTWHMDTERDVLREYGRLAEETTDERIRYLINLILDDEVRHHRLFQEMVNWLRAETESREVAGPRLPGREVMGAEERERLRGQTDELLRFEKEDAKELRELRRDIDAVEDTAWWSILIESMEFDTRKHMRILEYIRAETR
jgi:rubrerythrin